MKYFVLSLSSLLIPLSLAAKDPVAKGVLPELKLNKKNEADNIKTAAGAEALITKSEEAAIKQLEALLKKYKGTSQEPDLIFRLAELYARRSKTGRFVDLYRGDKKLADVLSPKLISVSAKTYLGKAIEQYQKLQSQFPRFAAMDEVLFNMGFAHDQRGEADLALATFLLLPEKFPRSPLLPEAHMAMGELYFLKQNYNESLKQFDTVLKWPKTPLAAVALYKSAWSSYNLKDTPLALNKLEKLLKPNKKQKLVAHVRSEARRDLALFYSELGAVDQALSYFKNHLFPREVGQTVLDLANIYERHGKLTEMDAILAQFLQENPNDENTGPVLIKRIQHHNEKHNYPLVVDLLQQTTKLCRQEKWKALTPETTVFCNQTYPSELKDLAVEWWESWNKLNRDKQLIPSLAFIFQEYLSTEKEGAWHVGLHLAYADFLFSQGDFKQATFHYEGITKLDNVEPAILHSALYGTIVSMDRQIQNQPKDPLLRTEILRYLNAYLERAPQGEYTNDVLFKKAFLFYEAKEYAQALKWIQQLTPKTVEMKEKREDLILEIHRSKKDYASLAKASLAMFKAASGPRAQQLKVVYQSAQQAIIQQNVEKEHFEKAALLAQDFYKEHRPETKALEALHLSIELWEKQKKYRPAAENSELLAKELKASRKPAEAEKLVLHANDLFMKLGDLKRTRTSLQLSLELLQDETKKKESLELLAELSNWFGDVELTEKAWSALEPSMSAQEKQSLLEKRLSFFEKHAPERAKKIKDSLISKGVEPFFSQSQLNQADRLCSEKKWSQCYQLALKLNKEATPAPQRAQARYLQAKVLMYEYQQQSLKAKPERLSLVMSYKAEKFDKAVQVLNGLSSKSEDLSLKKQSLQDLIALYNNYYEQLQKSLQEMDVTHPDVAALKQELMPILPVLQQRPKELTLVLTELNKVNEDSQKAQALSLRGPFPELSGQELRVYVPTWEETINQRPLKDLVVGDRSCVLTNIQKLNTLSALGREANACLLKNKPLELEVAALRMSDLFPEEPWGPFYLSVSSQQAKSFERALWYLKLAQKRRPEAILSFEEQRQLYYQRPDSLYLAELQKLEGPWALIEEKIFLTSLEQLKQGQCEAAGLSLKTLRAEHWKTTPLAKVAESRCPKPTPQTVTAVSASSP